MAADQTPLILGALAAGALLLTRSPGAADASPTSAPPLFEPTPEIDDPSDVEQGIAAAEAGLGFVDRVVNSIYDWIDMGRKTDDPAA